MLTRLRRRVAEPGDESGMTLIELIIAMGIFTIVLAIFMTGIATMTHQTVRVQSVADSTSDLRRAFQRLDRQVRYADAVNRPVTSGGNYYVEFQTDATSFTTGYDRCDQYRVNVAAGTLETRSWDVKTAPVATAWIAIVSNVVQRKNATTGVVIPPFLMSPTSSDYIRQRLTVRLDVRRRDSPVVQSDTVFVARNTTANTVTNADTNTDGVSDTQVCQQIGRS